ncbi:MAG: hypothetical protein JXA58_00570 [Dehalococcoidia bacterium]|nr:hypothetical protein [Dehalococcoidia bacterium]
MKEMTRRERMLTASRRQMADRVPFFHNWRHCQQGTVERDCRNRGMGLSWERVSYTFTWHGVEVTEKYETYTTDVQTIRRTFKTPVGTISQVEKRASGVGQWHHLRSWKDVTPWQTERAVKGPEDYKVLKYMYDNLEVKADYFPIEQAKDWIGDDGMVWDWLPHAGLQLLMIDWVGSEGGRFFVHHVRYPDLVEETYQSISRAYEPLWQIAAGSPADFFLLADNIDAVLVNPRLFKKYFMPEWDKCCSALHAGGKLVGVHADGRLKALKELIAETSIDVVEALHVPEMGDLSLGEALAAWPDKVIWTGFPGSVYALGPEATKKQALGMLRDMGTGERVCFEMSTENQVSNENLEMLTSVLEHATLPLTPEKIDEIERSLK